MSEYAPARRVLVGQLGRVRRARCTRRLRRRASRGLIRSPALREQLDAFGRPSEVFELAMAELAASQPPPREPVLLHGDFRLGNLIVGPEGLRAVLDWELTHVGNPAEDLGWLCVKAWRFGAAPPVAGLGSREELLAAYRAAGGADISLAELRWWEILGTLRWGVICLTQAWAHLSGAHRSVELAAIGRRVCEQEWDLLLLLDPDAADRAARARPRLTGDAAAGARALRPPDRQRAAGRGAGVPDRQRHAGHDRPARVPRQGRRQRASRSWRASWSSASSRLPVILVAVTSLTGSRPAWRSPTRSTSATASRGP